MIETSGVIPIPLVIKNLSTLAIVAEKSGTLSMLLPETPSMPLKTGDIICNSSDR